MMKPETADDYSDARQAADELQRLIKGYQVAQAIHVAAVLGVADHMAAGPRANDDLAAAVGAHPQTLYRLLRTLAAVGLFREHPQRCFSLTAVGARLRADAESSVRPSAIHQGQTYLWAAWCQLLHSVRTGEAAFPVVHGADVWSYRQRHPEENAIFNAAMTANSSRVDRTIVDTCDFSRYSRIADIGGGQGSLLAAILAAHPAAHGVLFDQPHVVSTAAPVLDAAGVADRCELVGGNMFESVPAGCGAYVMKFILHDWNDAECLRILRNCRQAMAADAHLFVCDRLVGPPNEDLTVKLSDLNMLVAQGGQERTREEFEALFDAAGLRLVSVLPTSTDLVVITGAPS